MNHRGVVIPVPRLLRTANFVAALSFSTTLSALASIAARAQPASTLVVGLSSNVTSFDPHFHNVTPNSGVAEHMFEVLIARNEEMRLKPGLAVSREALSDTTWGVKLRSSVHFHDGSESTSADVMYSLVYPATVKNSPSPFMIHTHGFKEVMALDKLTMRITINGPYSLVLNDLSTIYTVSKKTIEKVGMDDSSNGHAVIGIGSHKFVSSTRGDRLELMRFDGYWGKKLQWQHVTLRTLITDIPRVAAPLAGDVQVIESMPSPDIKKPSTNPAVLIFKMPVFHMMYLHTDSNRDASPFATGKTGRSLPKNPPKDAHVREVISLATSRQAIVDRMTRDATKPTGQPVNSALSGHVPGLKALAADLLAAKKLLAQVDYPDNFTITLHTTNSRYPNGDRATQVIASVLSRVGIITKAGTLSSVLFFTRTNKLDFSFLQAGWGTDMSEASPSLKALLVIFDPARGWGVSSRERYSNPALDAKLAEALQTLDDNKREELLQEATEIGIRDDGVIPLYSSVNVWTVRKDYTVVPRLDEQTYAFDVTH